MLNTPATERAGEFFAAIVDELAVRGRVLHLVHLISRLIRNLAVSELIIGGDCWDRGPRGDKVVDYLRKQPNVSFVWGNHDVSWLGACLGNDALLCTVLRFSLRYRRIAQIDEGYSIPTTPLEHLAETVYKDDPAKFFYPKIEGLRPMDLVARMHKAIAIMQFKLEGQLIARNPQWNLDHRRLLHRIDHKAGTITIDGVTYPLRDTLLPTIDPDRTRTNCRLKKTKRCDDCATVFSTSQKLYEHMQYLTGISAMYLIRDDNLIFHGCVSCDKSGEFLPMSIDGNDIQRQGALRRDSMRDHPRSWRNGASRIWICCGISGAGRDRRCLARIESRRWKGISSRTSDRTRRRRTPISA